MNLDCPTRSEAKERGLSHYFGKICEKHFGIKGRRYFSGGECIECSQERGRRRRQENKDYIKEYNARWYKKNKDHVRKRNTSYRQENKTKVRESNARWHQKNKNYNRRDRAKRVFNLSLEQYDALMDRDTCGLCGVIFLKGQKKNLDHCHKTRSIRGVLCHSCNIGLGHFKDRPDLLRAAAKYLERKGFKP